MLWDMPPSFFTAETETGINSKKVPYMLTKRDEDLLLKRARRSIETGLDGETMPPVEKISEAQEEKMGAFVTLKKHGRLRGCIGFIEGRKALHETVEEMARAAAFRDPRFRPVTRDELDDLNIEISVLTPLRRIRNIDEIEAGKHGIYVVKGFHSGLLLPQVAAEYNWDRITFLRETCGKAGLPGDAWKDKDTAIFIFSARVFGEE